MTTYVGSVAPASYVLAVLPAFTDDPALDLSTVTAATFHVLLPDNTTATWTATRSNQTSTTLTLTRVFAPGDLPMPGGYAIFATLTSPSGTTRTSTQTLVVTDTFS